MAEIIKDDLLLFAAGEALIKKSERNDGRLYLNASEIERIGEYILESSRHFYIKRYSSEIINYYLKANFVPVPGIAETYEPHGMTREDKLESLKMFTKSLQLRLNYSRDVIEFALDLAQCI